MGAAVAAPARVRELPFERIGMAFSGGGFRATLYHLGCIAALRDAGLLAKVRYITSVSGGSIAAAHLVLNWERYTGSAEGFDGAAAELIALTQSDARRRILRRWVFAWGTAVGGLSGRWSLTKLLQREYDRLFTVTRDKKKGPAALLDLSGPGRPVVNLLTTSMTTGKACWFSADGFHYGSHDPATNREVVGNVNSTDIRVSYAVACSSAFPPLFPPIRASARELHCQIEEFPTTNYLTDGGIFDNLGLEKIRDNFEEGARLFDTPIVSDAEGAFDWTVGHSYTFLIGRNIRASDLLMKRVSELQMSSLGEQVQPVVADIGRIVPRTDDAAMQIEQVQNAVRNMRTDLDRFSDAEVSALLRHGYHLARRALQAEGQWKPTGAWTRLTQAAAVAPSDLRGSDKRAFKPIGLDDWVTYPLVLMLLVYVLVPLGSLGYLKREATVQQAAAKGANEKLTEIAQPTKAVLSQNDQHLQDLASGIELARQRSHDPQARRVLEDSLKTVTQLRSDTLQLQSVVEQKAAPAENAPNPPVTPTATSGWLYLGGVDEGRSQWLSDSPRNIRPVRLPLTRQSRLTLSGETLVRADSQPLRHAEAAVVGTLPRGTILDVIEEPEYSHRISGGWFVWVKVSPVRGQ